MKEWENCVVYPKQSILHAVEVIDSSNTQIALVVDTKKHLLGTVTDGDIRRAILRGCSLDSPVENIMNQRPTIACQSQDKYSVFALMKARSLQQIPIVDQQGVLVGMEIIKEFICPPLRQNPVILMAGGLGTRLRPLTNNCPKPLLKIGEKPILETIIDNFIEYGFGKFYFAVNYKADMIKEYFGNGERFGISINYLNEEKRLGTAGALTLLSEKPKEPVIVMNGDLLTKVNFQHLVDFHTEHKSKATMCVREYSYQVPYGVVDIEKGRIAQIQEKPVLTSFVNAGIYVLNAEVVDLIPPNEFFDMPSLFKKVIERGECTAAFPIREYWMDIGRMDDFEKANDEFESVFK